MSDREGAAVQAGQPFDPDVPNVARVYDYLLGGKNNFAADRQLAEQILAAFPDSARVARQNRAFVGRAVRFCAEQGIGQFLDVGSGLPAVENVHEIVRSVIPDATVVYVDIDRVALSHANALLATSPGVTAILGDVREPGKILGHVTAGGLIDFSRPVAVLLAAVIPFVTDSEDPAGIVATFRDAMPSGSYLVLSHGTQDARPDDSGQVSVIYRDRGASSNLNLRSRAQIEALFAGFELIEPGLVATWQWRPQGTPDGHNQADMLAGVALKR